MMAEYGSWKPVVDIEGVKQARRQRAVYGRDPTAADPKISDAYMVAKRPVSTRDAVEDGSNLPVTPASVVQTQMGSGDPMGLGTAKARLPDYRKRLRQGSANATQGVPDAGGEAAVGNQGLMQDPSYGVPGVKMSDAELDAAVRAEGLAPQPPTPGQFRTSGNFPRDARRLVGAATAGPGAKRDALASDAELQQAQWTRMSDAELDAAVRAEQPAPLGGQLYDVRQARSGAVPLDLSPREQGAATRKALGDLASGVASDAALVGGAIDKTTKPGQEYFGGLFGGAEDAATADSVVAPTDLRTAATKPAAGTDTVEADPNTLPERGAQTTATALSPNSIVRVGGPEPVSAISSPVRATDLAMLPQATAPNPDAFSDENVARARADAQAFETSKTAQQARTVEDINADTAALRDLRRVQTNVADGFAPDAKRSKSMGPDLGNPSMEEAMRDYAAGRVGSEGYKMIRNLRVDAGDTERRDGKYVPSGKALTAASALEQAGGGQEPGSLSDAISLANLQRGLQNDQRSALQDAFGNQMEGSKLELAMTKEQRQRQEAARKAEKQRRARLVEGAAELPNTWETEYDWLAGQGSTLLNTLADSGRFESVGDLTQFLRGFVGNMQAQAEKAPDDSFEVSYENEPISNAAAMKILNDEWGGLGIPKDDREKIRQQVVRRTFGMMQQTLQEPRQ
jgi:hypothetical protein